MERGEEENQGLPSHLHHHVSCRHENGKETGAQIIKGFDIFPEKKRFETNSSVQLQYLMGLCKMDNVIPSVPFRYG